MARLANAIKMGYFPTPEIVFQLVSNWITPPSSESEGEQPRWRLLDPCAGRGEAIQLTNPVGGSCESWGVELSPKRAEEAGRVMDQVFNCGWRQTRVDRESVSLLWLNPPYDHDLDGEDQRLEIEFLRTAAPALVGGGVLVYVIPKRLLGYTGVARRLAGHFEDLMVRRFPDGEYERFQQVLVLGRKKPWKTPTTERVESIRSLADAARAVPPLTADPEPPWPVELPTAPSDARLRRVSVPRREQIARAHAAGWPEALLEAMRYRRQVDFRPALPPKKGHISMIMSSGARGIMPLHMNGRAMLVKGRTFKESVQRTEADGEGRRVTVTTYRPKSTVGIVDADGVRVLDEVEELKSFMEDYGDVLAEQILRQNEPLYNLNPPVEWWDALGKLGRNREPLPGQKEPALLETQKHVAIAMARAVTHCGSGLIQGEMGVGKTTTALAVIDLLNAYPAIVMCPPHLVPKWRREAREVIPGVQTRELERIGKTASMDHGVNDVARFIEDWEAGRLGEKAIAVVSSTSAKLGPGWEGAVAVRHTLPPEEYRGPFREALKAYHKARRELKALEENGAERSRLEGQRQVLQTLRRKALDAAIAYPVCPFCGQIQADGSEEVPEPVLDFDEFDRHARSCHRPVQGWARDNQGRPVLDEKGDPIWVWKPDDDEDAPLCGRALFEFGSRYRRWPIADYIKDQASGFFQMLVVDEIHHYKGKSSDRGIAFARMVGAAQWTLGLTGTIYGGKASDIYWLLYRLGIKDVRQVFSYRSSRKWVQRYGVLEERTYGSKGTSEDYGAFNATRRTRRRVTEKPGVSPGILRYLIDNTVFLALKDLGIGLPPYKEELAVVQPSKEQWEQYHKMSEHLKAMARSDTRYLSTWLQWSLGRPNSAFRDEEVVKMWREDGEVVRRELLARLPTVVGEEELLPKERWLTDYARAEVEAGRKVLVYCRQTGTRDIQPRLKRVLEEAGLRAEILSSGVGTREREKWVRVNAPRVHVLIVNPRLVETGLDLVQFATVVFYEINYSLFTMWQAMRRVWRLGQTQPVKVVFAAYDGTMEADALALMGQKMGAAQLLYGDEVGGALVPEDTGDFLTQLARTVLEGKELPDLQALFAEARPTTASAMGNPTARSPRLRFSVELRELWLEELGSGGSRRRSVPDAQMSLFAPA